MRRHLNVKVAGEFKVCFLKGRINCTSNYLFTIHLISTLIYLLCKRVPAFVSALLELIRFALFISALCLD